MGGTLLQATKKRDLLDPRTKLLLLVAIAVVVLGGAGGSALQPFAWILSVLPFLLLFLSGKRWQAAAGALALAAGYAVQYMVLPHASGMAGFLLLMTAGVAVRLIPGLVMGAYVLSTTTVSEFTAAFQRMHISDKLTIPLSVMFRFFPTVMEEFRCINAAMRMRDIRFGGKNMLQAVEYRAVPMMTCSVKIGEELAASALTRGLGGPKRRTNICEIGFRFWDGVCLLFVLVMAVFGILSALGVMG